MPAGPEPQARCRIPGMAYAENSYPAEHNMSHKHEHLLTTIFQDPISANIHWREVESLLSHLGAELEFLQGARIKVVLNGVEGILHKPHHSNVCAKQDIRHLREYLAHARMTPSLYEEAQKARA
jgi:hypothetical protein